MAQYCSAALSAYRSQPSKGSLIKTLTWMRRTWKNFGGGESGVCCLFFSPRCGLNKNTVFLDVGGGDYILNMRMVRNAPRQHSRDVRETDTANTEALEAGVPFQGPSQRRQRGQGLSWRPPLSSITPWESLWTWWENNAPLSSAQRRNCAQVLISDTLEDPGKRPKNTQTPKHFFEPYTPAWI